jgi:glucose/mannose-6-phosphate isomerase
MTSIDEQLAWEPKVERASSVPHTSIVVGGMGGSALAGHALAFLETDVHVRIHESYDLPHTLTPSAVYVAISYSGNTEETLSFAHMAHERGLPLECIASGGKLAEFAEQNNLPLVRVPEGLQPRNALVYQLKALCALAGVQDVLAASATLALSDVSAEADTLVSSMEGTVPVIYVGEHTWPIARVWKAQLNETAKIPAFASAVPMTNHFEIQSYDPTGPNAALAKNFLPVFVRDPKGDSRIEHRLEVLEGFLRERGYRTVSTALVGESRLEQFVNTLALAMQTAEKIALAHGTDPEQVPFVEEFKRKL